MRYTGNSFIGVITNISYLQIYYINTSFIIRTVCQNVQWYENQLSVTPYLRKKMIHKIYKHIKYLQRLRSMFMGVFEERERGDSPGKGVAGGAHGTSIPQSLTTPDCFSDK